VSDLFSKAAAARARPLADELRPNSLAEVLGQEHLLAGDAELSRRIKSGRLGSFLLYGPPGTGKTTIGRIIAKSINKEFRPLHSKNTGVAEIRKLMDEASMKELVVFIDEVHGLNKSQQDQLLEASETGLFDLILATTENPYININAALNSRGRIFQLKRLAPHHTAVLIDKALNYYRDEGIRATISDEARDTVIRYSNGDGRVAIGLIESTLTGRDPGEILIDQALLDKIMASAPVRFDKQGDMHYDVTSAFCKSMRGGDEDGTVFWLAALIKGGVDPVYIARRIMTHASEDVGLADNTCLASGEAAMTAAKTIGLPECAIILAHAALHVCRAPKSNSAYRAIGAALDFIDNNGIPDVPKHLRDTHYKGAAKLGHVGYIFPHDMEKGWADQSYLPEGIPTGAFYQSDARENPTYEAKADEFWDRRRTKKTPRRFP
jgi:putative ATPase